MSRLRISIAFMLSILASHQAGAQSRTVEEATKISRETGQPIFAMAGQKT